MNTNYNKTIQFRYFLINGELLYKTDQLAEIEIQLSEKLSILTKKEEEKELMQS